MNILLHKDNLNAVEMMTSCKKIMHAQQEITTNIKNVQLHESGMGVDHAIQYV